MKQNRFIDKIILGALIIGVIAVYTAQYVGHDPMSQGMGKNRQPGDLEVYYSIKTVLSNMNAFLLISLLVIYLNVYNEQG